LKLSINTFYWPPIDLDVLPDLTASC